MRRDLGPTVTILRVYDCIIFPCDDGCALCVCMADRNCERTKIQSNVVGAGRNEATNARTLAQLGIACC